MPLLRILAVVGLLSCNLIAQGPRSGPGLRESLKLPWKTLKFGLVIDSGDYVMAGPYLLLQRLGTQVVLSVIEEKPAAEQKLPVAVGLITEEQAAKLVETALEFYAVAEKESGKKAKVDALPQAESEAIYRKQGFGLNAIYITFEILGLDLTRSYDVSRSFSEDFGDGSPSITRFHKFLEESAAKK
jgi:hypothetical protein